MSAIIGPGRRVGGRYLLLQPIGQGGMGTVWRGRDELLSREVAIKEASPPSDLTADERAAFRERTLLEARTAARLNHANVVRVYDVVEEADGWPWIVMELVEARSLRDLVQADGPLTPEQAASVALQLMAALRAAHDVGIMHRDVKPGNILIDADGHAMLADFGVARTNDSPTLTASGMILGSPAYLPPERAKGGRGGPESDIWSLGATIYAVVEGHPPFDRNGALATLMAVAADEPDPPIRCGPLWPVISGLLQRDPAMRLTADAAETMLREIAGPDDLGRTVPVARSAEADTGRETDQPGDRLRLAEQTRAFRPAALRPGAAVADAPAVAPRPHQKGSPDGGDSERPVRSPDLARPRRWPGSLARGPLAAVAAVLVAAIALIVGLPKLSQDGRDSAGPAAAGHSASAPASRSARASSPSASPAPSGTATSPATGSRPAAVGARAPVPAGFRRYRDATGFSIAVPRNWTVSHQQGLIYVTPPAGRAFLMIQQTDHPNPNPLADWQQQEANRIGTYPDYHRILLAAIRYPQAAKAADWEFTYDRGGVPTRVLNRNVLANPAHAYALYWSVPAAQWNQDWHFFRTFALTFQPAGS